MTTSWERRRILIWGKTRPEVSKTYREIVCTGGVFADTRRLVRLYPIPLRYLNDQKVFKKYQWIEANVRRAQHDPRPESFNIRADEIEVGDTIPPGRGNWDARAEWVLQPMNVFQSVESLQTRQGEDNTSLGLVQPADIVDIVAVRVPKAEREGYWQRYREAEAQLSLPLGSERIVKPLTPADFRFQIKFRCDDRACLKPHTFSVLDWEIDALYFNQVKRGRSSEVAARDVVDKLRHVCGPGKDTHFFLGNISTHPHVFTIVGLWWPNRRRRAGRDLLSMMR